MDINQFHKSSQKQAPENKKFLTRLKKADPRNLDKVFHETHDQVFAEMDCLDCANCCKTTSPIFYQTDVDRLAKSLRMKPGAFIEKYLRVDEDKDLVLQQSPCPFLLSDNRCSVYEDRPKACREYPHTDRRKMVQVMDLTYKNTLVCPAVLEMVARIKSVFGPDGYRDQ